MGASAFELVGTDLVAMTTMKTALNSTDDSIKNYPVPSRPYPQIDLSTDASTAVSLGAPAVLTGIYVNASIGTSAVTIDNGTTPIYTLPVGLAAGTHLVFNTEFTTNITVNPADDSTGNITVEWRPV